MPPRVAPAALLLFALRLRVLVLLAGGLQALVDALLELVDGASERARRSMSDQARRRRRSRAPRPRAPRRRSRTLPGVAGRPHSAQEASDMVRCGSLGRARRASPRAPLRTGSGERGSCG